MLFRADQLQARRVAENALTKSQRTKNSGSDSDKYLRWTPVFLPRLFRSRLPCPGFLFATPAYPHVAVSNLGPAKRLCDVQTRVRPFPLAVNMIRVFPNHVKALFILKNPRLHKQHFFFMSLICLRTCFWVNSMSVVNLNLTRDMMLAKLVLTSNIWCGHCIGHTHLMNVRVLGISGSSSPRGYI